MHDGHVNGVATVVVSDKMHLTWHQRRQQKKTVSAAKLGEFAGELRRKMEGRT